MQKNMSKQRRFFIIVLIFIFVFTSMSSTIAMALDGTITKTTNFVFTEVGVTSSNYHFTLKDEQEKTWHGTCIDPNDQGIPQEGMNVSMSKIAGDAMIARIAYEGTKRTDLSIGAQRYIISRAAAYSLGRISAYSMREDVDKLLEAAESRTSIPENFIVYRTAESDYGQQILAWRNISPTIIKVKKSTKELTDYNIAGAKYGVYSSKTDAKEHTNRKATLTTKADGITNSIELYFTGEKTYYVSEYKAPDHFGLDDEVYKKVLQEGESWVVESVEPLLEETGFVKVKKTALRDGFVLEECSAQYSLAGAEYSIYTNSSLTSSSKIGVLTTDVNGDSNTLELKEGTYWIIETKASPGFALDGQGAQKIVIEKNKTTVHQSKEPPLFDPIVIILDKKSGNDKENKPSLAGAEFKVEYYGIIADRLSQLEGETPQRTWYFETKEEEIDGVVKGVIRLRDTYKVAGKGDALYKDANGAPVGMIGSYVITETRAPKGYVIDPNPILSTVRHSGTVTNPQVTYTNSSNQNNPKEFRLRLEKQDVETGSYAQGDATLAHAVFGLYRDGTLIKAFKTDETHIVMTPFYNIGKGSQVYTVKEITPPKGYLPHAAEYRLYELEGDTITAQYTTLDKNIKNDVIKGKIALTKISNAQSVTGALQPEPGVEFEVYLTSAGSYTAARPSEKQVIMTDSDGYAETKMLPYGNYTVHQVNATPGHDKISDFTVDIAEHHKVYRYTINNDEWDADVKVVKIDSETKQVIPVSGAIFKLRKAGSEEWIDFTMKYPNKHTVTEFMTDESGTFQLPDSLPFGNYELVEMKAPFGYERATEPLSFTVDGSEDLVELFVENTPQKGMIKIFKKGEVLKHITSNEDGSYEPVFEDAPLQDAVFDIFAKTDIVTPDGTKRYGAGEKVDTVTTGKDGVAESKLLYLGEYEVKEVIAGENHVLNPEVYTAKLTFDGEKLQVSTELQVKNDRQKAAVMLAKHLEEDVLYGFGENGYQDVIFGIYAAEEITAQDGTCIPKDGLLGTVGVTEVQDTYTGRFACDLPHGNYYLKEVKTVAGYILDDMKYPVSFSYKNQNDAIVNFMVNDGTAIENYLVRGNVSGCKFDEAGEVLAGAWMGLFPNGETVFTEETALLIDISDENGVFEFEDVAYGNYVVREIKAPTGYDLNVHEYAVDISVDEQTVELEVVNKKTDIEMQKTDVLPEAKPEDIPDSKPSPIEERKTYPDTGDNEHPIGWIMVAILGISGLIVGTKRRG